MFDCKHEKIKCHVCHRYLTPEDLPTQHNIAIDGRWLKDSDTVKEMLTLFFNNDGVLDDSIAAKLSTIVASKSPPHPAFEDIPVEAYTEFDEAVPF